MWVIVGKCVMKGQEMAKETTDMSAVMENLVGGFVKNYTHALDPKKRLTIPSQWRESVVGPKRFFVLPRSKDDFKRLGLYTEQMMAQKLQDLSQRPVSDGKAEDMARMLGSHADIVSWDSQGRVRICDSLLEFAGVTDKVVLAGCLRHIELWNPESWQEHEQSKGLSQLEGLMSNIGF